MCQGHSVYQGGPDGLIPYLEEYGYKCESYQNPADFALDVLIEASQNTEKLKVLHETHEKFSDSTLVQCLQKEVLFDFHVPSTLPPLQINQAGRGFGAEIFYVSQRTLKNTFRDPAMFLSQITVGILLALLIGVVYYDMKRTIEPGVQNRQGAIFFIIISQLFMASSALEPLLKERALFIHVSCLSMQVRKFMMKLNPNLL